jgi:hypothetical protein
LNRCSFAPFGDAPRLHLLKMRFFFKFREENKLSARKRKFMNRKNLILPKMALLLLGGCSLPFLQKAGQSSPNPASNPPSSSSLPETDIQRSFPLDALSRMASPDTYNSATPNGSFIIKSQSSLDALVKFYGHDLPAQGWTLRYTDANYSGGLTQYWKKDNIYLSMDFGPSAGQVTIHCLFDWVEASSASKLPAGFPLPGHAEMVKAEDTSWELYIPQDYGAVTNFYNQKLAALHWKAAPTPEARLGNCSGSDCVEIAGFPPGALPTATVDPRQANDLAFSMPDGNIIDLTITPHQKGTILGVDLILKNIQSAGLPQDMPLYPGALVQIIAPGSAEFQVSADLQTIENFYKDKLSAAGWVLDGAPTRVSGGYFQNWKKGDQAISITLVPSGTETGLLIECSTCNK